MAAPTLITELSQTAGSNGPAGSVSPIELDNYDRAHASFIAQLRDGKGHAATASVASATTTDIGAANSLSVEITGTTTITGFGTAYSGPRFLRFAGALILTHSASLALPGVANITTAAGDTCIALPNLAANGWNVVSYERSATLPVYPGANSTITSLSGLTTPLSVAQGGTGSAGAPSFSAYRSASGDAVAQATFVKVNFETEVWDKGSCFASSRFTPNVEGYYQINAVIELATAVPGFATIYKNGLEHKRSARTSVAGAGVSFAVSGLVYCNGSTDYIEIYTYHDGVASTTLVGAASETWFDGHFVRGVS